MKSAKVPLKTNVEMAVYDLSRYFIKHGYQTDVKQNEDFSYSAFIFKERFLKNVLGNATLIKATFVPLDDGIGVEVKESFVKISAENIIKEVAYNALVLPGIKKRIEVALLEKKVFDRALMILKKKMKDEVR
jgi:hypothetical protein